jgi:hypothetical protein
MSSKNFYGLTGDVTVDGGILNVGNAQLYANTETSNVGIGTSNPEFELDVHGNANVGVLYSTFLHGDGSNIQNIVSSQWEGSPGDPIYYESNVGIANTTPVTKTLQVGSNMYVEDAGSNVIHVTGNIYADYLVGDGSQLTGIAASLDQIVDQGNTVSNTIQLVSGQDATSNIGLVTHDGVGISISNTNPTGEFQFGVGSNLLVNVNSSNVLTVDGNVFAQKMTLGTVTVTPAYNLQQIMTAGPTSDQTLILSNVTTGLTTTSNVGIANTAPVHTLDVGSNLYVEDTGSNVLTVTGNAYISGDVNIGSNLYVEDTGSNVLTVTGNAYVTERLDVGSNLHIENLRVAEVAANLVTYDSSTGELMDSAGLFSNKLAVVSEQPPIALTGASTAVTSHGTYTIEASSGTVTELFDKNILTVWTTSQSYDTLDGSYTGSTSLADVSGEWVKITMPYKTILRHVKIKSTNSSIKDVTLVGLNADGLTWTSLKTVDGLNEETSTIIVNATTHHRTYGLIVRATNIGSSQAEIGDLSLFTESFSIDGGKVAMASSAVMGGETTVDQHGPHGRDGAAVLKKYPEIVFEGGKFDRNDSTNTYVQAGYTVTASGVTINNNILMAPWKLLDGISDHLSHRWRGEGVYVDNSSTANPSALDPSSPQTQLDTNTSIGEYLILKVPKKIKLKNIVVNGPHMHMPYEVDIYGRNEGVSTWTHVKNYTYTIPTGTDQSAWNTTNQTIDATEYYSEYAFVVVKTNGFTAPSIGELELYGYEEDPPAGDTSVDTTFTSIMNTPQTTGAKVYTDAKLSSAFTNRVTGPTPVGTATTYDETGKYWELTGELTSNVTLEANTFLEGDAPHSLSVWFNSSNLEANVSNTCVFSVSDQEKLDSVNLDLQSNTWHNLTYAYQGEGGSRVTYLDGRKVAEDQAEDTFGEYPPFAMTGYAQGGYVVSASDEDTTNDRHAWNMFGAGYWFTNAGTFATSGSYDASGGDTFIDTGGVSHTGHWLKLNTPFRFTLNWVDLFAPNSLNQPDSYVILGSGNDGTTWDLLYTETGYNMSSSTDTNSSNIVPPVDHDYAIVNAQNRYNTFLFIFKSLRSSGGKMHIKVDGFYGHRENDLVRLPDPTNVLKYPHISIPSSYTKRGYVVSASSDQYVYGANNIESRGAWAAFGNTGSEPGWQLYYDGPSNAPYTSSADGSGFYQNNALASTLTGTSHRGEWIKLELPHKLMVQKMKTDHGTQPERLGQVILLGSNNDSDWYTIKDTFALTTASAQTTDINATVAYKYIVLIVKSLQNASLNVDLKNLEYYGTGVDSVPIQIGGGNIDKVANFRVYDKFVGEDQALEIWDAQKDEFGRAKSSMTLQKGRLGIGTTEPQGRLAVLDEPHNLEEFPPRAMTGYKTHFEGHGEFCASASSYFGTYYPWEAFDRNITDNSSDQAVWHTTADFTNATPGIYNAGASLGGYTGAWLKLKLPYSIKPSKVSIHPRTYPGGTSNYDQNPKDFLILGSKDDNTWDVLSTQVGVVFGTTWKEFILSPGNNNYKYFAISCTKTKHGSYFAINDMKYFGTREQGQSVLHDGQLTLTKSLNVPRIGPALDADDTPRRDRLVVEYNTSTNPTFEGAVRDTSGRGFHGALFGGAHYDATEKALTFDAVTGTALESGILPLQGDASHSYSFWFNRKINGDDVLVSIATSPDVTNSASTMSNFYVTANGGGSWFHIQNDTTYPANTFTDGTWFHVVCIYKGGGASPTYKELYVNGIKITLSLSGHSTSGDPLNFTNPTLSLGGEHNGRSDYYFNGSISNFKLYDTALTAQEVKTLYDMGRTGSVVNPQPLHIAAPMQVEKTLRIPVDNTNTGAYTAGMIRFNKDLGKIQVHNGSAWLTIGGVSATGGAVTYADGYTIHTFTSSGTFNVISGGEVEYLVVAGGGGGANRDAGGGGAGGMLTGTLTNVTPDTYTITRGAGGAGGASTNGADGTNGSNSTALGFTAIGGGGGGAQGSNGGSGGSGGGGGYTAPGSGTGTGGQGNNGGLGRVATGYTGTGYAGGGGGGAGGVGGNARGLEDGGHGGGGLQSSISGTPTYYAGGGGGGGNDSGGTGGSGVGGNGGVPSGYNATANTGGGGGGARSGGGTGGAGGSGIVIIRYLS